MVEPTPPRRPPDETPPPGQTHHPKPPAGDHIAVHCPSCGTAGQVPASYAGKSVTCKRCAQTLSVPGGFELAPQATKGVEPKPARRAKVAYERQSVPAWVWLAAGGAVLAGLLAVVGGYFVYQDQQDRAARVAREEYQAIRAQADTALTEWSEDQNQRYIRLRSTGVAAAQAEEVAYNESRSGEPSKRVERLVGTLSRMEQRWGDRWRALGLTPPPRH